MRLRSPLTFQDGTTQSTAAPTSGGFTRARARAYRSAAQTLAVSGSLTKVLLDATEVDEAGGAAIFDSTNNQFLIKTAATYEIKAQVVAAAGNSVGIRQLFIVKNGLVSGKTLGINQYPAIGGVALRRTCARTSRLLAVSGHCRRTSARRI
jgi:hypothetical protein